MKIFLRILIVFSGFSWYGCGLQRTADGTYTSRTDEGNTIAILNNSFEGHPMKSEPYRNIPAYGLSFNTQLPNGWKSCESYFHSMFTFDGNQSKYAEFAMKALDGELYVGMAMDSNALKITFTQELSKSFQANKIHRLSLHTAFAEEFIHTSSKNKKYNRPGLLKIWGSNDGCELEQLFYQSELISNKEWKKITVNFIPESPFQYLVFEICGESDEIYHSNILIDKISNIEIMP